jgi:large subunit ribosomal protein L6
MSRVAKNPVSLPAGVEVKLSAEEIEVKGSKGSLKMDLDSAVEVKQDGSAITFTPRNGGKFANAISGTTRALVSNMVQGVTAGYEKKLQLIGVGYRAAVQGNKINLTLGFSHPVEYEVPQGVSAEAVSQTELLIKGTDKQLVGQVAAEIRGYRPPEPYKGKGVRYVGENVRRKEAKKK